MKERDRIIRVVRDDVIMELPVEHVRQGDVAVTQGQEVLLGSNGIWEGLGLTVPSDVELKLIRHQARG